jgi:Spy/CpxP family protein refolding chaperone
MAIALLAIVALAGMGLGFAADRLAMHGRRQEMRRGGPGGPGFAPMEGRRGHDGRRGGDGMRERFAHELDLTPEQQRRVDSIMSQQMADFRRIRSEMQPRFDSLLAKAQSRLDSVLTSAQREKLARLRDREAFGPRDSFGVREFRGGGGPPPPFP